MIEIKIILEMSKSSSFIIVSVSPIYSYFHNKLSILPGRCCNLPDPFNGESLHHWGGVIVCNLICGLSLELGLPPGAASINVKLD